jgi:hypothetical protein
VSRALRKNLRRFYCRECDMLRRVRSTVKSTDDNHTLLLECGHRRALALPPAPGRVSIENLNSDLGKRLFPFVLEAA